MDFTPDWISQIVAEEHKMPGTAPGSEAFFNLSICTLIRKNKKRE
jgi:hypothetical protein